MTTERITVQPISKTRALMAVTDAQVAHLVACDEGGDWAGTLAAVGRARDTAYVSGCSLDAVNRAIDRGFVRAGR